MSAAPMDLKICRALAVSRRIPGQACESVGYYKSLRCTESYRSARIPLPALRATFPPGEGMRLRRWGYGLPPALRATPLINGGQGMRLRRRRGHALALRREGEIRGIATPVCALARNDSRNGVSVRGGRMCLRGGWVWAYPTKKQKSS